MINQRPLSASGRRGPRALSLLERKGEGKTALKAGVLHPSWAWPDPTPSGGTTRTTQAFWSTRSSLPAPSPAVAFVRFHPRRTHRRLFRHNLLHRDRPQARHRPRDTPARQPGLSSLFPPHKSHFALLVGDRGPGALHKTANTARWRPTTHPTHRDRSLARSLARSRSLGRGARAFSGATECPPTLTPGGDTHPRQGRGLPVVGSPTPHPRTWVNAGWPGRTFGRSHGRSGYENERRNRDHRQLARKTGQSLSLVEREGGREAHGKQRVRLHDQ